MSAIASRMSRVASSGALTAAFLVGAAAVAWMVTVDRMSGMDMGPGTELGSFGWFAGLWTVMMAAMMLPSLVPMAAAYGERAREGTGTVLFVTGYLLPWVMAGAIAWVAFEGIRGLDPTFLHWDQGGRYAAAAVIAGAALYELTPQKATCLTHCRDRRLLLDGWHAGSLGALRMGLGQGAYCIGCCWGLMAALFALGVMSLTWMVVIAALIAIEKLLPWRGPALAITAGFLLALAVGVVLFPDQVPGLTLPMSAPMAAPTSMPMSM